MVARRFADHDGEEESYFVSMTDLVIGLLFIFIIMLMFFAMRFQVATTHSDEVTEKQNILIEDLTDSEKARTQVLQNIHDFLSSRGISVTIVEDELQLPEEVLFAKASWELNAKTAGRTLSVLADALDTVLPCYTQGTRSRQDNCPKTKAKIEAIFVEGHADSDAYSPQRVGPPSASQNQQPDGGLFSNMFRRQTAPPPAPVVHHSGPPKDNLDLSALRATSTFRELLRVKPALADYRNPDDKPVLSVSGYGASRPLKKEPNEPDEAYKQRNRRIDLRILMATPTSEDAKRLGRDLKLDTGP